MDEGEGKGGGDGCCEEGEEEQRPQDGEEEGGPHGSLVYYRVMKLLLAAAVAVFVLLQGRQEGKQAQSNAGGPDCVCTCLGWEGEEKMKMSTMLLSSSTLWSQGLTAHKEEASQEGKGSKSCCCFFDLLPSFPSLAITTAHAHGRSRTFHFGSTRTGWCMTCLTRIAGAIVAFG